MKLFSFFILTIFSIILIGCSPWSHKAQEHYWDDTYIEGRTSVTFRLISTEEQIAVPLKLQKFLVERLSDKSNLKTFPKSILMPIGYFYVNGKKWEWCGGRLYSFNIGYYYVSELDPAKTSSLYKFTQKYISKENRNTPEYAKRIKRLKNEVKQYFSVYNY